MKFWKIFSLSVAATVALVAFAGVGTASADELCTEPANAMNMCPAGKLITEVHGTLVGSARWAATDNSPINTCTTGTMKDNSISQGTGIRPVNGSPVYTWGSCNFPTKTVANGTLDASAASGGGTTVTATETQVTFNTVLFGSCVYGAGTGTDLGSIANGGKTLAVNVATSKISGGGACPAWVLFTATIEVTNHTAVFYITN
jgi:hypothetical protein